ncbi:MAG: hypothetical protein K6G83_10245 [Lachnospiraceae bacterium]|nr:hypothetical protein [Lachnospiraceae bacterium]
MIGFQNILRIILWGLCCPFLLGTLYMPLTDDYHHIRPAEQFSFGFVVMTAVFDLLAVYLILIRAPFHVLKNAWMIVILFLCLLSAFLLWRHRQTVFGPSFRSEKRGDRRTLYILFGTAVFLILCQTLLLTVRMHMDTDDARFIPEALEAIEKDTMLAYNPINGQYENYEKAFPKTPGMPVGEMLKDAASPYPIYLGLLSDLFGLNPAITAHTVLPSLFIPLSYLVFFLIGLYFFEGDLSKTAVFLIFLSVIFLFSFESKFALGYVLLNIIWQGRSVMAMVALPFLWYILLLYSDRPVTLRTFFILFLVNMSCSMLSGTGAILAGMLTVSYTIVRGFETRRLKTVLFMGLSAVPCAFCVYYGQRFLEKIF